MQLKLPDSPQGIKEIKNMLKEVPAAKWLAVSLAGSLLLLAMRAPEILHAVAELTR